MSIELMKEVEKQVASKKSQLNGNIAIDILSDITVFTKYAKYLPEKQRREIWEEIVTRNMNMHIKKYPLLEKEIRENYKLVYDKKILPSMRSLQFAGRPIEVNPSRVYNCAFAPVDDFRIFSEAMFLLLGGTGFGYSVQKHHVEQLPEIKKPTRKKRYLVGDSIEGWADAIRILTKAYFTGIPAPDFDFSDIRPKGARLITSGGKAPGPEPLKQCLINIQAIFESKNAGEKLEPIEAHDIMCHIADAVLAGGIRRAALISLFSFEDEYMINSKGNFKVTSWEHHIEKGPVDVSGEQMNVKVEHKDQTGKKYFDIEVTGTEPYYGNFIKKTLYWVSEDDVNNYLIPTGTLPWYYFQPQRGRANNSVTVVRHKIKKVEFFKLWKKIEASGSGEPGIYFTNDKDWGTNPCAEIALRPFQFCNLCEINASDITSQEDLNNRAKTAAFIGTLQAGYTNFHYLRDVWRKTTEKDALLGIGMTGIGSGEVLKYNLTEAADIASAENERIAKINGINTAARVTTVKPSGTSSLVLGTSSGIHAWHNDYYIRRMRLGKNEALYVYLSIYHPELLEDDFFIPEIQSIVSVPQKAPKGAILRTETAIDLLERVKKISNEWVKPGHRKGENTHNVSATISVKDDEWETVGKWMWENKEVYNGLSVLPFNGGTYRQAPFQDITEEQFNKMYKTLSSVDLTKVVEIEDLTNLSGEAACAGGACEVQ